MASTSAIDINPENEWRLRSGEPQGWARTVRPGAQSRAGTIEANADWVPWMLQSMDEACRKHHMWARPKLKNLPSDYYRAHCFSSFGEDRAAVELCESFGLQNNLMWAHDYPHHEGSWPHSAQAIERTLDNFLTEETRAKVLGLNAARIFRFEVPDNLRD